MLLTFSSLVTSHCHPPPRASLSVSPSSDVTASQLICQPVHRQAEQGNNLLHHGNRGEEGYEERQGETRTDGSGNNRQEGEVEEEEEGRNGRGREGGGKGVGGCSSWWWHYESSDVSGCWRSHDCTLRSWRKRHWRHGRKTRRTAEQEHTTVKLQLLPVWPPSQQPLPTQVWNIFSYSHLESHNVSFEEKWWIRAPESLSFLYISHIAAPSYFESYAILRKASILHRWKQLLAQPHFD